MAKSFKIDRSFALTALTAIGMIMATLALWPLQGAAAASFSVAGLSLVYLAGGLPAAWRAGVALWKERVLDIDLLMVVAAVAAMFVLPTLAWLPLAASLCAVLWLFLAPGKPQANRYGPPPHTAFGTSALSTNPTV